MQIVNTNKGILKGLLLVHGLITLAASIVLIVAPQAIPQTINIEISANEYILCYFLGASELSIAFLSIYSRKIEDRQALRLISIAFIVFHIATGLLEGLAFYQGVNAKIIFNIVIRFIISVLFWVYGVYKNKIL